MINGKLLILQLPRNITFTKFPQQPLNEAEEEWAESPDVPETEGAEAATEATGEEEEEEDAGAEVDLNNHQDQE